MQIFQLRKFQVIFEPQAMMLKPFADIRDKNNDDDLTLKELSFIWFFTDVRSDFMNILDDNERIKEIKLAINLPQKWKPSKEVKEGIEFYKKYSKTPSSGLYKASVNAAQFIETKLKEPEKLLERTDSRGNPIYKLDSLLKLLQGIPDAMQKLHNAREQVVREVEEKAQLRGNKEKATFEDGI